MDKQLLTDKARELLNNTDQSIVIVTHTNPDGDAIGSCLALYGCLKSAAFKKVETIIPNQDPEFLHWMPHHEKMIVATENQTIAENLIADADLIFCLDFNQLNRTDNLEDALSRASGKKILMDHHPEPGPGFDLYFSDTAVSSTAELVYEFLIAAKLENHIDQAVGECIYAGIVTDTGSFSYGSNQPRTYEIMSELMSLNIDGERIHRLIYSTYSEHRMRLLGYCLSEKLVVLSELRTAYISLERKELYRFKHQVGDTEGVVNFALSMRNIDLAALFTENKDHIKISFRSSGQIDVNEFARRYFNGGGHRNASGGKSYVNMKQTLEKFELAVKEFMHA